MITQNIIGYDLSSSSGKFIKAYDPAKRISLPEKFSTATSDEVDRALQKAVAAWRILRSMDPVKRAAFLTAIADGIESLGDLLVNRIMQETAYAEARVLVERRRTVSQLRMFANYIVNGNWRDVVIDHAIPGRVPSPKPDLRKMNMAIGPVIVFAASNFPLAYSTAGGDTVSAFAAGCPVIIKAHESHPGTNALVAEVVMQAARETGMPDGVFSSLNGDGYHTGQQLVSHPLTAAVGFTGSLSGGRALFDIAAKRASPIPVFAEMGSVNPVFLLPSKVNADDNLHHVLAGSMTLSAGQFCTNPGILIALDNNDTHTLIARIGESISKVPPATLLNENISSGFYKSVEGVKDVTGITFISETAHDQHAFAHVLATVKGKDFLSNPLLHHEVFGPFSLFVLCSDTDQMMQVAWSLEGQLTATIHGNGTEKETVDMLLEILIEKAGRIIFNGVPTGVEVCEAMTHGGPYPASTDSRFTAVGHHAIRRWLRPVTYQNCPQEWLPDFLR